MTELEFLSINFLSQIHVACKGNKFVDFNKAKFILAELIRNG